MLATLLDEDFFLYESPAERESRALSWKERGRSLARLDTGSLFLKSVAMQRGGESTLDLVALRSRARQSP